MQNGRLVLIAAVAAGVAGMAGAQSRPAEPPPPRYTEREYVDSAGCVFARVGITATIAWVPRIGTDGKPVCGKVPTFPPEPGAAVAAAPAGETGDAVAGDAVAGEAVPPAPVAAEEVAEAVPPPAPAPKKAKARKHRRPGPLVIVETEVIEETTGICPAHADRAVRLWLSDGRRITKCGPAPEDEVAFVNGLGVPGLMVQGVEPGPGAAERARAKGQKGYRVSWTSADAVPMAEPKAATDPAPTPASGAGRYVQIGAFAEPANAERALAALGDMGLPSARQRFRGGRLTAILAGPLADAGMLAETLALLQGSGYPQAFARD